MMRNCFDSCVGQQDGMFPTEEFYPLGIPFSVFFAKNLILKKNNLASYLC